METSPLPSVCQRHRSKRHTHGPAICPGAAAPAPRFGSEKRILPWSAASCTQPCSAHGSDKELGNVPRGGGGDMPSHCPVKVGGCRSVPRTRCAHSLTAESALCGFSSAAPAATPAALRLDDPQRRSSSPAWGLGTSGPIDVPALTRDPVISGGPGNCQDLQVQRRLCASGGPSRERAEGRAGREPLPPPPGRPRPGPLPHRPALPAQCLKWMKEAEGHLAVDS